ncbi:protein espinas-like [Photinus pyralis]|uniref:protein espinas-like n=1 Tax=Photinus pyralis TaxID=7054 RepID=UPI001267530A|nr:protein espinas-like [Photinus pyralis]
MLPNSDVPRLGTKGEVIRTQRILKQLPRQDLSINACKHIEPENRSSYQDFINARNEIALDVGCVRTALPDMSCMGCSKSILPQQTCVSAPRLGKNLWHPPCFKCSTCDDLLVDLAYCVFEDNVYCERHYAEKLKPRCASCDEVSA